MCIAFSPCVIVRIPVEVEERFFPSLNEKNPCNDFTEGEAASLLPPRDCAMISRAISAAMVTIS